jgi:flagellar hook-length control protein FliK
MQTTTTLPIQPNGIAPAARNNAGSSVDPGQFSAALSREIEQRQDLSAPAPSPKPAEQAKPAQAKKDAGQAKAPVQEPEKPAQAKAADKAEDSADARDGDGDKEATAAAEHPATAQVTDMLALVASLNQSLRKAAPGAATTETAASALGARAGVDAAQLAALQSAARAFGKDSGDAGAGKAFNAFDHLKNPTAATLGAGIAAQATGKDGADLGAGQAVLAKFKLQPDAAQVAAPARDALPQMPALPDAVPSAQLLAQMQPATLQAAQAAASVAGEHIPARVGSSGWDQQVGQKIVWMAADGEQSAELTLNPPDLGPLQVVLNVSNDGASVEFSSNQLEVRQALENALPRLREMMSESGIALGNATVNAGMPDQRQAPSDGQGGGNRASQSRLGSTASVAEPAPRPSARVTGLGDRGMVDTFA